MIRKVLLSLGFFVATGLLSPSPSWADIPSTVGLHLASIHSDPGFNNVNPGGYLIFGDSKDPVSGFTMGSYRNSYKLQSSYIGYSKSFPFSDRTQLSLQAGFVSGYKQVSGLQWSPMIAPSAIIEVGSGVSFRVFYLPKSNPKTSHVLSFALECAL